MTREAWTDERLDDLRQYLRADIRELREKQRELRAELSSLRRELIDEIRSSRR
jgi:hypothetical protein